MKPNDLVEQLLGENGDVETAMARLEATAANIRQRDPSAEPFSDRDRESTLNVVKQKLADGWTVDEVVSYANFTEEVNPTLSEQFALTRMKQVLDRVAARKTQKATPPADQFDPRRYDSG